ncbi:MAG: FAD-dependent oxidoreductase [Anaerolineaceae bacterium]|jgi:NADPH-dependent 2,4-dienoyl-CoA reductase/sulfur reductase-like enzyme|nr:MAG: FAD-dependent oxidoreductase [Anaerolineaceae bacterium]
MKIRKCDVAVIGSGPGGLAAAIAAKKNGAKQVLLIERDSEPGGILLQCIHNGFGVEIFKKDLPGPAYAQHFINEAQEVGVDFLLDTMVLEITKEKRIFASNKTEGMLEIQAKAVILAMGCRERTRAQVRLPGARPAGVYTAGTAQRWVNVEGYMPGKKIVILGSGDIGMIMARRLTFEGAKVERVLEIMPYLSGLMRNYVQCLQDFGIPLQMQHTVKRIIGNERVEAIETVAVDDTWQEVPGSEEIIPCDTLLLSVGLIPENELSRQVGIHLDPLTSGPIVDNYFQTETEGFFAAGNVVHVYDLVDWVTGAGLRAGESASIYANGNLQTSDKKMAVQHGQNVHHVIPHYLDINSLAAREEQLQMRVTKPLEQPVKVQVTDGKEVIASKSLPYARPGEMVTIILKDKHIDPLKNADHLVVQVIEREG